MIKIILVIPMCDEGVERYLRDWGLLHRADQLIGLPFELALERFERQDSMFAKLCRIWQRRAVSSVSRARRVEMRVSHMTRP